MNITCEKHGDQVGRLTSAIIAEDVFPKTADITYEILNIFYISDSGNRYCFYVDKQTLDRYNLHNGQEIKGDSPDFEIFYSGLVPTCSKCLDEFIALHTGND